MASDARVRGASTRLVALIIEASAQSKTFRGLVDRISTTDGIVYVAEGQCAQGVRSCLLPTMTIAGPNRVLRIDSRTSDRDLLWFIGHELQHAVEVLSNPQIRSSSEMILLHKKICNACGLRFETEAAIAAGVAVRAELRESVGLPRSAAADPRRSLRIALHVGDDYRISPNIVSRARDEMSRIYRDAGIDIVWAKQVPARTGPDDSFASADPHLTLVILSRELSDGLPVAATALGVAVGTREYRGRTAYVSYDRVERVARTYLNTLSRRGTHDTDNVIVLAHAMAHEVGHLLLPFGHSTTGLMRADWDAKDMRLAVHGSLNFTSDQAELIRTRLLALLPD